MFGHHHRRLSASLLLLVAAITPAGQHRLSVRGEAICLDGEPVKLLGLRCSNALISEATTQDLIDHLDGYRRYGLNTVSVFLMGSRFGDVQGYRPDASLDPVIAARLGRIIEAADERGMAVLVGCLYWSTSRAKADLAGLWTQAEANRAVAETVRWLAAHDYRNVFLDVDNEGMAHRAEGWSIAALIDAGHAVDPSYVIAYNNRGPVPENADLCIHHSPRVPGKPWLNTESTPHNAPGGYWGRFSKQTHQAGGDAYYNYSRIGRYTASMKADQIAQTRAGMEQAGGILLASTWLQCAPAEGVGGPFCDPGGRSEIEDVDRDIDALPPEAGIRWWLEFVRDTYGPGRDVTTSARHAEILRDRWGVPHVFADTDAGALYGLGYVTAEDRAFQMTFNLRIIQGRLAEVLGDRPHTRRRETAVQHDIKMRTFGFQRAAQRVAAALDPETRSLLEAYSAGVNAYLREHGDRLNPLFATLGLAPEPWTPADCIASWWHVGQFFGTDGTRELIAWRNARNPGARAGRGGGRPAPPRIAADDAVAVIQPEDLPAGWIDAVNAYLKEQGFGPEVGDADAHSPAGPSFSHAWVVGGRRTTTGSAVLVSDPQTPVANPALFHEAHVHGATFDARGIFVPGSPVILIGFTPHVAWGATALGADQADLFRLVTDPNRPNQYRLDGQWRDMTLRRETIRVRGGRDRRIVVRGTVFGPVVTALAFARPGDPEVAVKRIPLCETDRETVQGAFRMLRARDVAGFDAALAGWRFPSINCLFGDRTGHIGFRTAVAQPLRAPGVTDLNRAQDGSRSANDWQGIVPHHLMPHVIDPRAGALFSANHRPIVSAYRVPLGNATGSQGDTVRSWRLRELITARDRFTPEQVLAIHHDTVNPSHRDIVRLGLHLSQRRPEALSPEARRALAVLGPWYDRGAHMDLRQAGAVLAGNLNTMFRIVNTDLAGTYGGGQTGLCRFLRAVTARLARPDGHLTDAEARYVDRLLAEAWRRTVQAAGDDPQAWPARSLAALTRQKLAYFHSLDGYGSLDRQYDLSYPALTCTDGNTILSQRAQSYTQFVPLDAPDRALTILPVGASEIPGHRFHANLLDDWAAGRLHPAPLSRAAVEAVTVARQTLPLPQLGESL